MAKSQVPVALSRDAMHDSPKGDWLDSIIGAVNKLADSHNSALAGQINLGDNITAQLVTLTVNVPNGVATIPETGLSWDNPNSRLNLASGGIKFPDGSIETHAPKVCWAAAHQSFSQTFTSGSLTIINYDTVDGQSPSGLVTTGLFWRFTVPTGMGGLYAISASLVMNVFFGGRLRMDLYKNGSQYRIIAFTPSPTTSESWSVIGAIVVKLLDGDAVDMRLDQNSGASITSVATAELQNISIARIGDA